ncbi:unknown [Choristoneura fumiferana multiple nucleopolyhedrovirus]|uniref:Uncharacterized protein n=1 Tax=Choristoneura fumiferana nuclear polyhedrosis virus TaxID=208973 RepID=Q7TLP5_NPVCF|nr:unknown [Choristoneura fumiferana multiple nucleopolyhedrovirus]AAP29886.1 unknown [Choristoneura fumiferana multiple nucleopolyhedrovirus]AGR56932.1 hypothetical protein [Choristoneura occidentalis alphabaculovirus]
MNKSTYKLFRELVSIKRAQWTMNGLCFGSVMLVVGLACYGAAVINNQISTISRSVAAQLHNQEQLQRRIVAALAAERSADFNYPLVMGSSTVMINVNTFAHAVNVSAVDAAYFSACPASGRYESYLAQLYKLPRPPHISNVFLFAGGHGLGKTYASYQLGRALSRFADTVVISVPMNTFGNINDAGALMASWEEALQGKCFIVWTFDELDSYVMRNRDDMRDKKITQFAEYTGFIKNANRVLVFTMNNAEMLLHDYWADRKSIEANFTNYEHADDLRRALAFTRTDIGTFLQEAQLSRLRSFVGNKLFVYRPFIAQTAKAFATQYLAHAHVNASVETLFDDSAMFSVRTVKITLDDIINKV